MMSHRKNKSTPASTKDKEIAELKEELTRALVAIEKLQKQNELLRVENEDLKRSGKRQATPFARRKWVTDPKKPGRKAGQGRFARREKPLAQQVNETKVARLGGCPECGHTLKAIRKHEQYVADIPVMVCR